MIATRPTNGSQEGQQMKADEPNANKWNPLIEEWLDIELTNGHDGRGNKWFSSAKVR